MTFGDEHIRYTWPNLTSTISLEVNGDFRRKRIYFFVEKYENFECGNDYYS